MLFGLIGSLLILFILFLPLFFFMGIGGAVIKKVYNFFSGNTGNNFSGEAKSCPSCKSIISGSYKYCPFCQTNLNKTCHKCGTILIPHWKYCPHCGE